MDQSSKKKTAVKKAVKGKVAQEKAITTRKTPVKKKAAVKKNVTTTVARKKVASKPSRPAKADISSISITPEDRWKMIAIAAYHKAEARGFAPGGEVQDWLDAEEEIDILFSR